MNAKIIVPFKDTGGKEMITSPSNRDIVGSSLGNWSQVNTTTIVALYGAIFATITSTSNAQGVELGYTFLEPIHIGMTYNVSCFLAVTNTDGNTGNHYQFSFGNAFSSGFNLSAPESATNKESADLVATSKTSNLKLQKEYAANPSQAFFAREFRVTEKCFTRVIDRSENDTLFYVESYGTLDASSSAIGVLGGATCIKIVLPPPFLGAYYEFVVSNSITKLNGTVGTLNKPIIFAATSSKGEEGATIISYNVHETEGAINVGTGKTSVTIGRAANNTVGDNLRFTSDGTNWFCIGSTDLASFEA